MKRSQLSAAIVALFVATTSLAQPTEVNSRRASGGMSTEFKNHRLEPAKDPVPLPTINEPSAAQKRIIDQAHRMFENNQGALSILIVDRGQILFERYRAPATEKTAQFSWSMSKSLTAYTIGNMLCEGKIANLDDPAKKYAPELEGTVQGDASVRNLLTMSSGARESVGGGNSYKTQDTDDWMDTRAGKFSGMEIVRKFGARDIPSGQEFRYLGNDTQALNAVAQNRGGLIQNFDQYIWKQARTENPGYWLLDRDGWAVSQAGFSATTRDWARLAMQAIHMQKASSSCVQDFMRSATTQQIRNRTKRSGKMFDGYGYQTWTNPNFGDRKSYWWVGYGGQRVGVDPAKERIIIVSSWREDYMPEVYDLFTNLQKM